MLDKLFAKRISRVDYAELVSKELVDVGLNQVSYDEEQFSLKIADGSTVFLDNGYENYCAASRDLQKSVLTQFVAGISSRDSVPTDFASASRHLIPVIRSASYYSLAQLQSNATGDEYSGYQGATNSLTDDLVVGLAYDSERCILHINKQSFDRWGMGFDLALSASRDNLRDRTDPNGLVEQAPGLFLGNWGDSYESSRLLLTDLIYRLPLDGEPIAFVPARNRFWVCGSENMDGMKTMVELGQQSHLGSYPLSPNLFLLSDGAWKAYVPETKDLRDSLFSLYRQRQALDYGQQKQYLEAIHQRDGIDTLVASYLVAKENDGKREYSFCVWSNRVDTMLPITEEIYLMVESETKDRVSVSQEVAQAVVGHLFERQGDLIPERLRVRCFPSEREIAELRRTMAK
jgi:hypothetical protein